MAEVISKFYRNIVRIKIQPSSLYCNHILTTSATRNGFQDDISNIVQNHGISLNGNWIIVGQVNIPTHNNEKFPTGNTIDDSLEDFIIQYNEFNKMVNGVQFPCISFNLISIYREC